MADEWAPKTREDWTGLFADGFTQADARRREEAAKREEEEAKAKAAAGGGKPEGGNADEKPLTFAERLLGVKRG